jgi:hypothetical protein
MEYGIDQGIQVGKELMGDLGTETGHNTFATMNVRPL